MVKKPTARYSIKLLHKDKIVLQTDSSHFGRFYHQTRSIPWQKAYLKVTYLPKVYNDGWYEKPDELEKAFSDFTEKDLIEFAHTHEWDR